MSDVKRTHAQILGENIDKCQKALGYSRKQLAQVLGINEISFGCYIRGVREPSLDKIFKLADFLKVPVAELVGENYLGDDKYFEWRLRRATKLCTLANYTVDCENNGTVNVTLENETFKGSPYEIIENERLMIPAFRNDFISIRSREDFVEVVERTEEKMIEKNVTFDSAFKNFMRNFYESYKKSLIDAFRKENSEHYKELENKGLVDTSDFDEETLQKMKQDDTLADINWA
ncbi:MAG: helix-turn-helix transcriptional regulator [Selenomonadaceae bacterium]|nr:helix-turn-helix transcriptional regulator [Selenomonadaceae bacterium]